jgi:hypothetical protein
LAQPALLLKDPLLERKTKMISSDGNQENLALHWTPTRVGAILTIWVLWTALPFYVFGSNSYVCVHDSADQMLSAMVGFSRGLSSPALWASGWASGVDWLSQGFTNELYVLPFFVLPGWAAYALVMVVQRGLAAFFFYRLLRNRLDLNQLAALFGAFALSVAPQLDVPLGFTLYQGFGEPAFALILLLLTSPTTSRARLYWGSAVAGVLYALCSGFAYSAFILVLIPVWFTIFSENIKRRHWKAAIVFAGAWAVAEGPVIAATLLNTPFSHRAGRNPAAIGGIHEILLRLLDIAVCNVAFLVLAIYSIIFKNKKRREAAWLLATSLVCAGGLVIWFFVTNQKSIPLPGAVRGFGWWRLTELVPILVITAAALTLNLLLDSKEKRHNWGDWLTYSALAYVLLLSLMVNARMFRALLHGENYSEIYQNPDLLELSDKIRGSGFPPPRVVSVGVHPAFAWGYGFETADGYLLLYPKRYQDYWDMVIGGALAKDAKWNAYFNDWGNRIYLFVPDIDYSDQTLPFDQLFNLDLLSMQNVKYVISNRPLQGNGLALLPSQRRASQLQWLLKPRRSRYLDIIHGKAPGTPLYIYENTSVLPRMFCATQTASLSRSDVSAALQKSDLEGLSKKMLVDSGVSANAPSGGRVEPRHYSATCIIADVTSNSGCGLIVSNSFSPYWHAWSDNSVAALRPADLAFQGIQIPAGTHRIRLEYRPPYAFGVPACSNEGATQATQR